MPITQYQQNLITDHLDLPYTIAQCRVKSYTLIQNEYEDLCQEGNLALCNAALHYHEGSPATFRTYASCAIQNRINSYLKSHKKFPVLHTTDDLLSDKEPMDQYEFSLDDSEVSMLLTSIQSQYHGITAKGIDALRLYVLGYDLQMISKIYKVTPKNISAWISRAKKALRTNPQIQKLYS